eukprot:scaffold3364_cov38-Prasinocladus_malaysianus.AAC.1
MQLNHSCGEYHSLARTKKANKAIINAIIPSLPGQANFYLIIVIIYQPTHAINLDATGLFMHKLCH